MNYHTQPTHAFICHTGGNKSFYFSVEWKESCQALHTIVYKCSNVSHISEKKGVDWLAPERSLKGFTWPVEPRITMASYDLRSRRGQAISSRHKGQDEKDWEWLLFTQPELNLVAPLTRPLYLGLSHTRCMLGKAHAGKLPVHLLWRLLLSPWHWHRKRSGHSWV